ncbi:uncharacterized protein LOC127005287 [Eriocheir sinensis]|uniref:uncharacterized protein LOC127005287 n=1 Tax=Eriocheir sinensis TaxID=95602 RepID=UPI0021C900D3|nr:uncharacterized protein LOC127005287 [Eriocheir sinensis]
MAPRRDGQGPGAWQPPRAWGYRPTINWQEIAVQRKLVANKQVLACIVVSGVVIVTTGVILTVLGFLVIKSQCPFLWRERAGLCYYVAKHNTTWEDGRAYCTSQSAALLHLHSLAEADFVTELMSGRSWLGARRKPGQQESWKWTDSGASLNYSRWPGGSVPASLRSDLCAAVEPSGEWLAVECDADETAYVICDYTPGYNPFVLVGPVVAGCGVVVLILSVEVCIRHRESISKNRKLGDQDESDREVDEGIINYGYGNFGAEEEEEEEDKRKKIAEEEAEKNKDLQRIQKVVVSPGKTKEEETKEEEEEEKEEEEGEEATEGGEEESGSPKVEVVPASPSPAPLSIPSVDENSPSQENLELLLSPKTLE